MSLKRPKILIADDTPANLIALKRILRSVDAELIEAVDGNEVLKQSLSHPDIALALLDVQMPGMDGYEAAEFMGADPDTCNIPIIFLTAVNHAPEHELKGYRVGAIDFIRKPLQAEILLCKVNILIDLWIMRQKLSDELVERKKLKINSVTCHAMTL